MPLLPSRPSGPENSLSYKELEVKFRTNTERTLPADRVEELRDALNHSTSWTASTMSCGPYEPVRRVNTNPNDDRQRQPLSAASTKCRRSLPQNISSPTKNAGAPNTPRSMASAGGGGWGPISAPTLQSSGRMQPRKVVGTVDTSEFVVALCASLGFLVSLTFAEIPLGVVAALLIGGVIAAPLAAWLVRLLHPRVLGTAVAGVILLTNARTFLKAIGVDPSVNYFVYAAIVAIWLVALYFALSFARRDSRPLIGTEASAHQ